MTAEVFVSPRGRAGRLEGRYPCFDGIRAVAVLMVIVYHSVFFATWFDTWAGRFLGNLNAGVWIFFVTSGFLLYLPFAAEHLRDGPAVSPRGFATRRFAAHLPGLLGSDRVLYLRRSPSDDQRGRGFRPEPHVDVHLCPGPQSVPRRSSTGMEPGRRADVLRVSSVLRGGDRSARSPVAAVGGRAGRRRRVVRHRSRRDRRNRRRLQRPVDHGVTATCRRVRARYVPRGPQLRTVASAHRDATRTAGSACVDLVGSRVRRVRRHPARLAHRTARGHDRGADHRSPTFARYSSDSSS